MSEFAYIVINKYDGEDDTYYFCDSLATAMEYIEQRSNACTWCENANCITKIVKSEGPVFDKLLQQINDEGCLTLNDCEPGYYYVVKRLRMNKSTK